MDDRKDISRYSDPRWSEILALWPTARRCLCLLDDLIGVGTKPDGLAGLGVSREDGISAEVAEILQSEQVVKHTRIRRGPVPIKEISVQQAQRVLGINLLEQYLPCLDRLSERQWAAFYLCKVMGMTQAQAASQLEPPATRKAVYGLVQRAKQIKAQYDAELREERFKVGRKYGQS